jgi:hypothetical protein
MIVYCVCRYTKFDTPLGRTEIPGSGALQLWVNYWDIIQKCMYSEVCLNWTSFGPTFVFGIDRCYVNQVNLTKIFYIRTIMYGLYRIPVYSGFSLDRLHCKYLRNIFVQYQIILCVAKYHLSLKCFSFHCFIEVCYEGLGL